MKRSFEELLKSDRKRYEKKCSSCGKLIIYFHKSENFGKPKICPFCGSSDWNKPQVEIDLFLLQEKLHSTNSQEEKKKIIGSMYLIIYEYSERMIKSLMKSKKILSKDDLSMKAHDTSSLILQRFLEDPSYSMRQSFGGNIKKVILGVLFGEKKSDSVLSLDYSKNGESNFGDFVSDEDIHSSDLTYEEQYIENENFCDEEGLSQDVVKIVAEFSNEIRKNDQVGSILFLAGVYNTFLRKNKQSMSLFYLISGSEIKSSVDYFQVYLRKYLKNNLGAI